MSEHPWPPWWCPVHLIEIEDQQESAVCPRGEVFRKRHGIPRFVEDKTYAAAFGAQWNRYRLTQLDSYSGTTITAERTQRLLGDELWFNLQGRHVAELGCGAGRFTEILLQQGALVTSIDLSDAVDANAQNFPIGMRHRVAQADILKLPFQPRQFDLVFCVGVIQHTPSPESTISALYEHVRPGGHLVFDHWTKTLLWYTRTIPLLRLWLRHLEPARGIRVTERLVAGLLPLHKRASGLRPARVLLKRLSPVMSFYEEFPELNDELQRQWALLDTHDTLTAWYRHGRTTAQIRCHLEDLSLEDISCESNGLGVEARGKRPPRGSA